jgi:hypothetical protein
MSATMLNLRVHAKVLRTVAMLVLVSIPAAGVPTPVPAQVASREVLPCSFSAEASPTVYRDQADTLAMHVDRAKTIVEAEAQTVVFQDSVAIQGPIGPYGDYTDRRVEFVALQVFKGDPALKRFDLFLKWASGYFLVMPGQRFVLFLGAEVSRNATGIPRYEGKGPQVDRTVELVCIESGRIWGDFNTYAITSGRPAPWGTADRSFVNDIAYFAQTPGIKGQIIVESGRKEDILGDQRWDTTSFYESFGAGTNSPMVKLTPTDAPRGQTVAVQRPMISQRTAGPVIQAASFSFFSAKLRLQPNEGLRGDVDYAFLPRSAQEAGASVTMRNDGVFDARLAPGFWRVTPDAVPLGYYVKSISAGAIDLIRDPLRVTTTGADDIRITLTDQPPDPKRANHRVTGRVTGIPTDLSAESYETLRVVLAVDDKDSHAPPLQKRPTKDGQFEFLQIPPGRYTVTLKVFRNSLEAAQILSSATLEVGAADASVELPFPSRVP